MSNKFIQLAIGVIGCALTIQATPMTYDLTFTGGLYDGSTLQLPLRPAGGSFTYDPNTGFSNFYVNGYFVTGFLGSPTPDTFDFTAAANRDAAQTFAALTSSAAGWYGNDSSEYAQYSSLSLYGESLTISATGAIYPYYGYEDLLTGTVTVTPAAPTPEPATVALFGSALGFLGMSRLRKRSCNCREDGSSPGQKGSLSHYSQL